MNGPTIRDVTAADLQQVRDLLVETWHAAYDGLYGRDRVTEITDRWHSIENMAGSLGQVGTCFVLAEEAGDAVGTALARAVDDVGIDLRRLYVHPRHQGRGIGAALLDHVIAAYPRARRMVLDVEPENQRAIAFYQRHGFRLTGVLNDGGELPAVEMIRLL